MSLARPWSHVSTTLPLAVYADVLKLPLFVEVGQPYRTVPNSESRPPRGAYAPRACERLLGLFVLRLEIGRQRAKSVQQSVDALGPERE